MSDTERTRLRASRLFALALRAREEGRLDYAEELTKLAAEAFDHATEMERRSDATPPAPATEAPQQPAQQRQAQPKKE